MKIQRKTLEILAKFIAERVTTEEILTLLSSYGFKKEQSNEKNWKLLYETFFQLASSSKPSSHEKLIKIIDDIFHPSLFQKNDNIKSHLDRLNSYLESDGFRFTNIFGEISLSSIHHFDFKEDGYYEINGIQISADGTVVINDIKRKYKPDGPIFKILIELIIESEAKFREYGSDIITDQELKDCSGIVDWEKIKRLIREVRRNHKINIFESNPEAEIFIPLRKAYRFNPFFKAQ
ncbi:MAG: hypothetical protein M1366_01155 [Patescibacteria group bacterium]|nr:hypothetical protein [Patescibacteria group bacterium]